MFLDVHLSKWADISDAGDVDRELVVEVDDVCGFVPQSETQYERSDERTEQFLNQKRLTNAQHVRQCHSLHSELFVQQTNNYKAKTSITCTA